MKLKCRIFAISSGITIIAICLCLPWYAGAQPAQVKKQVDNSNNQTSQVQPQQYVDFTIFYNCLKPYGYWENNAVYGQVWVCNQPGFIPYFSGGSWVCTNAGWAWSSTCTWGWAPFHYGRWAFINHWLWVPGYEWAPAWVSWRTGGGFYGWAPLAPGMGISVGYANYMPAERWVFCPWACINLPGFAKYCPAKGENIRIITKTTIVNNVTEYHNTKFFAGPYKEEVERYTGAPVNTVTVSPAPKPAGNAGVNKTPVAKGKNADTTQQINNTGLPGRHAVYNKNRPQPMQPHADNRPQ